MAKRKRTPATKTPGPSSTHSRDRTMHFDLAVLAEHETFLRGVQQALPRPTDPYTEPVESRRRAVEGLLRSVADTRLMLSSANRKLVDDAVHGWLPLLGERVVELRTAVSFDPDVAEAKRAARLLHRGRPRDEAAWRVVARKVILQKQHKASSAWELFQVVGRRATNEGIIADAVKTDQHPGCLRVSGQCPKGYHLHVRQARGDARLASVAHRPTFADFVSLVRARHRQSS